MIARLERIYADTIGAEFMHIQNTRIRNWVRHRLESRPGSTPLRAGCRWRCCARLLEAESFEVFLHSRYVGQKRFSLQGAEVAHGDSRHDSAQMPDVRHRRNLHGHGASRPAERAGEFFEESRFA